MPSLFDSVMKSLGVQHPGVQPTRQRTPATPQPRNYPLDTSASVSLDDTGSGRIQIGPVKPWESRRVTNVAVSVTDPPERYQLLTNPGFEVDTAGWTTTAPGTIARSTTQHRTGIACAFFDPVAGGDMRTSVFFRYRNITYDVSLYAIHSSASNRLLTAGYAYYDENQSFISSVFPIVNAAVPAVTWDTQFAYTVPNNLGTNVKYFRPVFGCNLSMFVDDVSVDFATSTFQPQAQVYNGQVQPGNLVAGTYSGANDSTSLDVVLLSGQYLTVEWTGGVPGTVATPSLLGTMNYIHAAHTVA